MSSSMPRPPGLVHCAWRPVRSGLLCTNAGGVEEWQQRCTPSVEVCEIPVRRRSKHAPPHAARGWDCLSVYFS